MAASCQLQVWQNFWVGVSYRTYLKVPSVLVPAFLYDFERQRPSGAAMVVEAEGDDPFLLFAWAADSLQGAHLNLSPLW